MSILSILNPHAQRDPSDFNATVWAPPASTATIPVKLLTCTGIDLFVVVPSPNALLLYLHAQTVPSSP